MAAVFSIDLSSKRLSSRRLTEALSKLVGVLEEEEASAATTTYLPRALELCAARNEVTRLDLPPPSEDEESSEPHGEMMDMLMGELAPRRLNLSNRVSLEDRLTVLDLSRNRLGPVLADGTLARLWRLTCLDLSSNRLASTAGIELAANLEELSLRDNALKDLDGLGALAHLRRLDVARNRLGLSGLRHLALRRDPTVADLDIAGNPACEQPRARRVLCDMLPRLRHLRGLPDGGRLAPANRTHDTYLDVHARRTDQPLVDAPIVAPVKKRTTSRPATRPVARPAVELAGPPAVPRRRVVDDDERSDRSSADLPWRQPPNPVPRWMLERQIGPAAATTVLRKTYNKKPATPSAATPPVVHSKTPRDPPPPKPVLDASPSSVRTTVPARAPQRKKPPPPDDDDRAASSPASDGPANILEALEHIVRYQRGEYAARQSTAALYSSSRRSSVTDESPRGGTPITRRG